MQAFAPVTFGPQAEVAKIQAIEEGDRPDELIFIVSQPVSLRARGAARAAWRGPGPVDFWCGAEFDEMVKRHSEIVREFFGVTLSDRIAPHEIPMVPADFIGRTRELSDLLRQSPASSIIVITGMGGVGKTCLATKLAGQFRAPDTR